MLEHGMDLSLIGAIVKKFNSQVFAESLADEDGKIRSDIMVIQSEKDGAILVNSNINDPKFCISLLTYLANIMGHIIKSDYSLYESGGGERNLRASSSQIRSVFIPIIKFVYNSIFKNDKFHNHIDPTEKKLYVKVVRNIWGYLIIFRGLSEQQISFRSLFDSDNYSCLELMHLAYLITPPLLAPCMANEPNALLEPEFPPEIVTILSEDLLEYFQEKYPKIKKIFSKLPEDLLILLAEIELVYTNQVVYLQNIAVEEDISQHPLPHLVEDIFYYLKHDDIIALPDMVSVITAQAHDYLEKYFEIILQKERASSFVRTVVQKSYSVFIEHL